MRELDRYKAEVLTLKKQLTAVAADLKRNQVKHSIIQSLANNLVVEPMKGLPKAKIKPKKGQKIEHLVLHLSDGHVDHIVTEEQTGGLEEYNFDVACARAEVLVEEVIDWTASLRDHCFTRLWILANGDHVNGEIHNAIQTSEWKNAFKSALACGQLHSLMFRDLAAHFDDIQVIYTPGNHGRRSKKKDYERPQNNWDYLVARTAKLHCQDLPGVRFSIPNSFSIALNINGHGFYVSHGDDIKSSLGIPFYGIQRKTQRLTALSTITGQALKYFCLGHFHQGSSLANVGRSEVLMNGAWIGTDPYCYESLSGYNEPCQLLHGVHKKHGVSWRMRMYMKKVGEKPKRYQICGD